MEPLNQFLQDQTRRTFLKHSGLAAGRIALGSLLFPGLFQAAAATKTARTHPPLPGLPHFVPKARRLIYLFMNGAPSQIDLWDEKPKLNDLYDSDLPESIRQGQRLTTMTSGQKRFPSRRRSTGSPVMATVARGSVSCCRTRRRSSMNWPSSRLSTPRPSTTTRPRPSS
jgi:hypothetical protein